MSLVERGVEEQLHLEPAELLGLLMRKLNYH
jgi:hypothetical protein